MKPQQGARRSPCCGLKAYFEEELLNEKKNISWLAVSIIMILAIILVSACTYIAPKPTPTLASMPTATPDTTASAVGTTIPVNYSVYGVAGSGGIPISSTAPAAVSNIPVNAAAKGQAPVYLGSANYFAVLAGSTVTNTGPTTVTGYLGVSPGSAVTGFPPGKVIGVQHVSDPFAAGAKLDLTIAYNNAAGRTLAPISVSGNIVGRTLAPACINLRPRWRYRQGISHWMPVATRMLCSFSR